MLRLREPNATLAAGIAELRQQIESELGWMSRLIDQAFGRILLWSARHEAAAYPGGRPLEPQTFVERRNWR